MIELAGVIWVMTKETFIDIFGFIEFWVEFLPSAMGEILKLQLIGMQLPEKITRRTSTFREKPFCREVSEILNHNPQPN